MKVIVDYDPATGNLVAKDGFHITSMPAIEHHLEQAGDDETGIKQLIELKRAGFDTDDIVELRRKGII
ncbi:MAG: hypothetical protein OQK12_16810 [Motiliproteus sp.]|nr:hypothetical protein [Motiliproteus sp.]MCW9051251.1 hypothetical protein [Motiliproteus sp.]